MVFQEKRLTCNRIFRHLTVYSQQAFTGRIDIKGDGQDHPNWSLFLEAGKVIWATGGSHPIRRWQRNLYLATYTQSNLNFINQNSSCWDYKELVNLSQKGYLTLEQTTQVAEGIILEILFDIVQAFELQILPYLEHPLNQLPSLSNLTGIGDGMIVQPFPQNSPTEEQYNRLPRTLFPSVYRLQQLTQRYWKRWLKLGLWQYSPNWCLALKDQKALQANTNKHTYKNFLTIEEHEYTIRDLAVKAKRNKSIINVGKFLKPYLKKDLITLKPTVDLEPDALGLTQSRENLPTVLCIDANLDNHQTWRTLAQQAGYDYNGVNQELDGIYHLTEQSDSQPDLILVSNQLQLFNSLELCSILRRISHLQSVPIIIYQNQRKKRKQVQEAFRAGATQLLGSESFDYNYLISVLNQYKTAQGNDHQNSERYSITGGIFNSFGTFVGSLLTNPNGSPGTRTQS